MNLFREPAAGLLEPGMHSSIRAIASSRKKQGTPIFEWSQDGA